MKRLLIFLLGALAITYVRHRYISARQAGAQAETSAPRQTLDHVQQKADTIGHDWQRRADAP